MARGKPREDAVLAATIVVLQSHGYAALTIDRVAAVAHASKATIYRRWAGKPELVKAALDALDAAHDATVPDTGALRTDLLAVVRSLREKASQPYLAMMTDVVAAARHDPVLARLLQAHVEDETLSPFRAVLQRAKLRGVVSRSVDEGLVHDVAEAMIVQRLQRGRRLDTAFAGRLVDGVLLPLVQARAVRS
jgi:AcrR family transcriptional regulator